jgi:hypothetical protein
MLPRMRMLRLTRSLPCAWASTSPRAQGAGVYAEPSKFADNWRLGASLQAEHEPCDKGAEAEGVGEGGEGLLASDEGEG